MSTTGKSGELTFLSKAASYSISCQRPTADYSHGGKRGGNER
jgi:hypothetical protein